MVLHAGYILCSASEIEKVVRSSQNLTIKALPKYGNKLTYHAISSFSHYNSGSSNDHTDMCYPAFNFVPGKHSFHRAAWLQPTQLFLFLASAFQSLRPSLSFLVSQFATLWEFSEWHSLSSDPSALIPEGKHGVWLSAVRIRVD